MRVAVLVLMICLAPWPATARHDGKPSPATPVEPIAGILEAFHAHAVVAICDPHGNQQLHDFLLRLIRDSRLPGSVHDIVIEAANARYQELVDRFVRGEDVAVEALRPVWQESTQVQFALDPPLYTEILPAIRTVNAALTPERKLRVLLGDPPIDWTEINTPADHRRWIEQRETFPADLIRREVLAKKRRALLVFGQMHFQRKNAAANFTSEGPAASIVSLLENIPNTQVFTIWWATGLEKLQPDVATWPVPSLALVRGTVLGAADFTYDGPRFAIRGGQPDFANPIPREQWRSLRAEDQYDAVLYLGPRSYITRLNPSKVLCADEAYIQRRLDRLAVVQASPAIVNDFKQACVP
jgi:hypothetical protein